jgi:hypothetical protein
MLMAADLTVISSSTSFPCTTVSPRVRIAKLTAELGVPDDWIERQIRRDLSPRWTGEETAQCKSGSSAAQLATQSRIHCPRWLTRERAFSNRRRLGVL